ncbi:mediator of RNA polymerase ii transcription [Anaeramoeba flamelloides]|uniref:Mediator of RNA polymerase II transcription subunit 9 n=1 Tax=Anaeramoeba flamelloides TaxID=1746091 RepID=A0AAV7ZDB9_9EUKA|nr:mediator of RNA polymerase ii transcription subunit [Anaeramoeba flamelloides]KAJ6231188.1 mediator of RNA polymerase ii transcription [Anaeramoeba flamelloides]
MTELSSQFELLPIVLELLDSINNKSKNDVVRSVKAFKDKIESCQRLLKTLPGTDLSKSKQNKLLQQELQLLEEKKKLLRKFENSKILHEFVTSENDQKD